VRAITEIALASSMTLPPPRATMQSHFSFLTTSIVASASVTHGFSRTWFQIVTFKFSFFSRSTTRPR